MKLKNQGNQVNLHRMVINFDIWPHTVKRSPDDTCFCSISISSFDVRSFPSTYRPVSFLFMERTHCPICMFLL